MKKIIFLALFIILLGTNAFALTVDMPVIYNNIYYEGVYLPGQTVNIPCTITNSSSEEKKIIAYIAVYDLSGSLYELVQYDHINVAANETKTVNLTKELPNEASYYAKVFMWEKGILDPIANNIYMNNQGTDYYSGNYSDSLSIEFERQICGIINAVNDIDILKFKPVVTGLYAVKLSANTGTVCSMYDSEQTILSSVSSTADNNYLLYELSAGENYYLRFTGSTNNGYTLKSSYISETNTVLKNIGFSDTISEYNLYTFTPGTSGEFIVTAVNSNGVEANLYNSAYEHIATADTTGSNVSFRITSNMTANQTYYILVTPKSTESTGTYTLYVEEPFALVSVE